MAITFDEAVNPLPLFSVEVSPDSVPVDRDLRTLLIGHAVGGSAVKNQVYGPLNGQTVRQRFGAGSMLDWMYRAYRANSPFTEVHGVAVQPALGSTQAVGKIQVTGIPTYDDMLRMWIGGHEVNVVVNHREARVTLAERIHNVISQINASQAALLPVKSFYNKHTHPTVVTLQARWPGDSGNKIDININNAKQLEQGLLTITQMRGGSGAADLSTVFAALAPEYFDVIVVGHSASDSQLDAADSFMRDMWAPLNQKYGHCFFADAASLAQLVSKYTPRNGPHLTTMMLSNVDVGSPPWEVAAMLGAQVSAHFTAPPEVSRPLQTLQLIGMVPPSKGINWRQPADHISLLNAGVSTWRVADDRQTVLIEDVVTHYKRNIYGDPDDSWKGLNTMYQTMYFVRSMRSAITSAFPRCALTTQRTSIQGFTSPPQIRDEFIHEYMRLEARGLVENSALFAQALIVERDANNTNRVNALLRPDLVNQFKLLGAVVKTNLELTPELISPVLA